MSQLYHAGDLQVMIDRWMEQENKGEQFPVPFDIAWQIAGYATKASAKRYLPKSSHGAFFNVNVEKSGGRGRPVERIMLSCDGLKHLCLMADTTQGNEIRQYFIEAEKKWRLVQQVAPDMAQQIELMHLQIELEKIKASKEAAIAQAKAADVQLLHTRQYIAQHLPEPIQQKILGYQTITQTEVVERVIDTATGRVSEGVGITYIAKALGFKSTKECWAWLESVGYGKDSGRWQEEIYAGTSHKLSREDFAHLKSILPDSPNRQLWLGE